MTWTIHATSTAPSSTGCAPVSDADYCWLGDLGIEGNGHMLMLENNGEQILDVICSRIAPWG